MGGHHALGHSSLVLGSSSPRAVGSSSSRAVESSGPRVPLPRVLKSSDPWASRIFTVFSLSLGHGSSGSFGFWALGSSDRAQSRSSGPGSSGSRVLFSAFVLGSDQVMGPGSSGTRVFFCACPWVLGSSYMYVCLCVCVRACVCARANCACMCAQLPATCIPSCINFPRLAWPLTSKKSQKVQD